METRSSNKSLFIGIAIAAVAVVAGLGGFFGGVSYQKGKGSSNSNLTSGTGDTGSFQGQDPSSFRGSGGPSGAMGDSTIGTVTAVSSSSITVENAQSGDSTTYAIVSTTQITKDSTIASYSDITTDSTVMVTADSANTSNALSINVDPDFGGASGGPQGIQMN